MLRSLAAMTIALAVSGCNFHFTTSSDDPALNRVAHENFRDLAREDDERILARLSAENDVEEVRANLPMLRDLLGPNMPGTAIRADGQVVRATNGTFYMVDQTYSLSDRTAVVSTTFVQEGKAWKIQKFHVHVRMKPERAPAPQNPREAPSKA